MSCDTSTCIWLTKILLSAGTDTVRPRASCTVCDAFGRFTFAADSTIADVVIMKMISSTRKMSVSGVMLISAISPSWDSSALNLLSAMDASQIGRLENLAEPHPQQGVEVRDLHLHPVEEDDGDDRDYEAERRRDQRLGDSGGD